MWEEFGVVSSVMGDSMRARTSDKVAMVASKEREEVGRKEGAKVGSKQYLGFPWLLWGTCRKEERLTHLGTAR